jgi:AcrR family transcriptional regulator
MPRTPPEDHVWGGQPRSARVAGRRQRLLSAGFELVAEVGAPGVTVREVCRRAALNPRYFYESFDDLDALLVAMFDAIVADTVATTLAAIERAPATAHDKTRAALDAAFRSLTGDAGRAPFLLADALAHPALAQRRVNLVRVAAAQMAEQAATFYGVPRDDELVQSSTYMLAGGLIELLMAWHNGSLDLSLDELIEHATLLTVGTSRAAGRLAGRTRPGDSRA